MFNKLKVILSILLISQVASASFVVRDGSITSAKIATSAVSTTKIADGAVTQVKRVALPYAISTSNINQVITNNTSFSQLTNGTVTLTTNGRPVRVGLIAVPGTSVTNSQLSVFSTGATISTKTNLSANLRYKRDGTVICTFTTNANVENNGSQLSLNFPLSGFECFDTGAASGSHTYTIEMRGADSDTGYQVIASLLAYEL